MKKGRSFLIVNVVLMVAVLMLHSGTIRKKDDPIRNTQTDPIGYEQKMEEIKDGEKGPPTPSFRYYLKRLFLIDPPWRRDDKKGNEKEAEEEKERIPAEQDEIQAEETPEAFFEDDSQLDSGKLSDDDWWSEDWEEPEGKSKGNSDY